MAGLVGTHFLPLPLLYVILSWVYSFWSKRLPIIDVLRLETFYSLRVFSGGIATGIHISEWLLAFSLFLFFSLAVVKRSAQARSHEYHGSEQDCGQGLSSERPGTYSILGVTSGYLSALVLAQHI